MYPERLAEASCDVAALGPRAEDPRLLLPDPQRRTRLEQSVVSSRCESYVMRSGLVVTYRRFVNQALTMRGQSYLLTGLRSPSHRFLPAGHMFA
jgi:hypothetical protein